MMMASFTFEGFLHVAADDDGQRSLFQHPGIGIGGGQFLHLVLAGDGHKVPGLFVDICFLIIVYFLWFYLIKFMNWGRSSRLGAASPSAWIF